MNIKRPRKYLANIEHFLQSHTHFVFWATLIGAVLLAISRRPDLFFNAQFWAEDGAVWYTEAYHSGFWATLFKPYPEYLASVQRLFASISTFLPFIHAPLLLNAVGLAFQLLPLVIICSERFRYIIKSRVLAIGIALLFVGILNASEVYGSFANMQWHLGLAAFLVLIATPSKRLNWQIFDSSILIANGLSGPLSIILLPITFFLWVRERSLYRIRQMIIITICAVAQLLTIFVFSPVSRLGHSTDVNLLSLVQVIVGQIFIGSLLGEQQITMYYQEAWSLSLCLVGGVAFLTYCLLRGPQWLKLFIGYAILVVTATLASLKAGDGYDVWLGLINPTAGQRYWYIAILAWLAAIVWAVFAAKSKLMRLGALYLLLVLLFGGFSQNWSFKPLPDQNFIHHARKLDVAKHGQAVVIPINPPGWKMTLYKK